MCMHENATRKPITFYVNLKKIFFRLFFLSLKTEKKPNILVSLLDTQPWEVWRLISIFHLFPVPHLSMYSRKLSTRFSTNWGLNQSAIPTSGTSNTVEFSAAIKTPRKSFSLTLAAFLKLLRNCFILLTSSHEFNLLVWQMWLIFTHDPDSFFNLAVLLIN